MKILHSVILCKALAMSISWTITSFLLLLILVQLETSRAIWFPWYFHRYGFEPHSSRHSGAINAAPAAGPGKGQSSKSNKGSSATCPPGYELKGSKSHSPSVRLCDDNPVVMQLARLYVVSPERIVLLLAQPLLAESCDEIADVLEHIRGATSNCILADDNIYGKLTNGLRYYKSEVCDGGSESSGNRKRCASLNDAHNCLKELRTDMIECEAPADWYEKRNESKVCQTFNNVLDCYYTRGAMLCGLEAAKQLRSFAGDSMKRAMIQSCEVNKRLPKVNDPMLISATSSKQSSGLLWGFLCAYYLLRVL
ncbi:uncharacterized protein LOC117564464 [Drosophila albomicans]|uniref:Uncharacterized protein LOC117564464 n=1 Tax=Drosophila albomicans TaxID=7291 RepID=A0A6P8XKI7_DROAB|nr:uncharacterized protein LOC117564464 [Drosophila albomicans]